MASDLPGLPAAPAERWLREALPGLIQDGPWHAEVISGGLSNITYRLQLAWMKLAVICEGVHARYLGGQTVGSGYEKVGPAVPLLVARGLRALGSG